jgi:pimeloyl-ACP methyl ester carboxylesterase
VRSLAGRADVTLLGLQVWRTPPGRAYGMSREVEAVTAAASGDPVHVFGFSAGGTVALAAALALAGTLRSVTVLEPAFIGDDDWDAAEAAWRSRLGDVAALPPAERMTAFRPLLMRPGLQPPPPRKLPRWGSRDELLEPSPLESGLAAPRRGVSRCAGARVPGAAPLRAAVSR